MPPEEFRSPELVQFPSIIKTIGLLCTLASLLWLVNQVVPGVTGLERIAANWVTNHPLLGVTGFIAAGALLSGIGLPRQSVALVGGYLFGAVVGTILALLATLAGCMLAWYVAARFGRDRLFRHLPVLAIEVQKWTANRVFATTLILRLLPVGSNLLINLAAGAGGVPSRPFFIASCVGFLPQTIAFALTGRGVSESDVVPLVLGVVLLGVSMGIAAWIAYQEGL